MIGSTYVRNEPVDDGAIGRVILNRHDRRNAQNRGLLVEFGNAFERAEQDDKERVLNLSGADRAFSADHDLRSPEAMAERATGPDQHPSYTGADATCPGFKAKWHQEWHSYFRNTRRWRHMRKITITQVHGPVFSAALMLAWCCDQIVAAEDAVLADVVGTRFGMCGVEYFAHPWEFGWRLAKELLLTGDPLDARTAAQFQVLSRVFPADGTLEIARRIARLPMMTALRIKDLVNRSVDAMGFPSALKTAFALYQGNHAHWTVLSEGRTAVGTPEFGLRLWKGAQPVPRRTT